MKLILIVLLLFSSSNLFAKECFKDKQADSIVCYKRYFDRNKIHKAKDDARYYTSKNGIIYEIEDKIEVRFNSVGAILLILKEYDVDFVDKTKGEKYILKVRDKNKLFSTIRKLNDLNAVQKALPVKLRKYTKDYVEYNLKKRQEKLERIQDKLENSGKQKAKPRNAMPSGTQGFKFGD